MTPDDQYLKFINIARERPMRFVSLIQKQISMFLDDRHLRLNSEDLYQTVQGKKAWLEAKDFLMRQSKLQPLTKHVGLCQAATQHKNDLCHRQFIDHVGSNGSTFSERILKYCKKGPGSVVEIIGTEFDIGKRNTPEMMILSLIIDDGIENKTHRGIIFNPNFRYIGWSQGKIGKKIFTVFNLTQSNFETYGKKLSEEETQRSSDNKSSKNVSQEQLYEKQDQKQLLKRDKKPTVNDTSTIKNKYDPLSFKDKVKNIHGNQNNVETQKHLKIPQMQQNQINNNNSRSRIKSFNDGIDDNYKQLKQMKLKKDKNSSNQGQSTFLCKICQQNWTTKQKRFLSKCQHQFCRLCLEDYVSSQLQSGREIKCPVDQCSQKLNMQGQFYKQLGPQLKNKIAKSKSITATNQNSRFCFAEQCSGILKNADQMTLKCNKCQKNFCSKCFLPKHEGQCKKHQLQFFKTNLGLRTCKKCNNIIQRDGGCVHIKCICKYQFCYRCGLPWQSNHPNTCTAMNNQDRQYFVNVDELQQENRFTCFEGLGGHSTFGIILRILVKVFLMFPLFLACLLCLGLAFVIFLIFTLLAILIIGVSKYAYEEFQAQQSAPIKVLLVIFFPALMVLGIVRGTKLHCQRFMSELTELKELGGACFRDMFLRW